MTRSSLHDHEKEIRKLAAKGHGPGAIFNLLDINTTCNAVIGFIYRKCIKAAACIPKNHLPKRIRSKKPALVVQQVERQFSKPEVASSKIVPCSNMLRDGCLWPVGDPKENGFRFCDATRKNGYSYCDDHCNVAYVKPIKRAAKICAAMPSIYALDKEHINMVTA